MDPQLIEWSIELLLTTGKEFENLMRKHFRIGYHLHIHFLLTVFPHFEDPWERKSSWKVDDNTKRQQKPMGFYSVLLAMTRDPAKYWEPFTPKNEF